MTIVTIYGDKRVQSSNETITEVKRMGFKKQKQKQSLCELDRVSFEALKEGKAFLHILHREGLVHKNKFQSKSINHQMDYSYDMIGSFDMSARRVL